MDDRGTKLTVAMVTYNHATFAQQAIDGVLMQRTEFDFDLVIADDASTDGTRDILRNAAARDSRIRLVLHDKNMGCWGNPNYASVFAECTSPFVAFLDGDDYWTDPGKLQAQVDLLEQNPAYSGVFHPVAIVDEDGRTVVNYSPLLKPKPRYRLDDLLFLNLIPFSSVVYRSELLRELPEWPFKTICFDWAFHLLAAARGDIAFIDRVMGRYRRHGEGAWGGLDRRMQIRQLIDFTKDLPRFIAQADPRLTRRAVGMHWVDLAIENARGKHYASALSSIGNALRSAPFDVRFWLYLIRRGTPRLRSAPG